MPKLYVRLAHCYGIKKLEYDFEFTDDCRTYAIYAPNGVMKTSFAKTVSDYTGGKSESRDAVFSREPYLRSLCDESGSDFTSENMFVINSYVDTKFASDKLSTLLVRSALRERYERAFKNLVDAKKPIIAELSSNTQSSDCEKEVIRTFSDLGDNFFDIVRSLLVDLRRDGAKYPIYNFRYNNIFDNSSVENFIKKHKASIKLYHDKYYEILKESDGFFAEDGSFGTVQASSVSKSVSDDAFFKAGHKFILKNQSVPVESSKAFRDEIEKAKAKVLSDPELKKQFDKIDSALAPNTLSGLREIVREHRELLLELLDFKEFQQNYWKSHLAQLLDKLEDLDEQYAKDKKIIDAIIEEANNESDLWKETLRVFKSRFTDLPFKVDVKDKKDAVLGLAKPELTYTFIDRDTGETKEIEKDSLTQNVLSNGEKRAFYLLNIIFEIQSRLHDGQETLFVIDDIADSFDYKNKYAIVEYLHDMSKEDNFFLLVLTHNFDFYRTVTLRLKVREENRLFAQKESDRISMLKEADACPMDPFKKWKSSLDEVHVLALIPFVRNLIEYGNYDPRSYLTLTSLLHKKHARRYNVDGRAYPTVGVSAYNESNGDFSVSKTEDILYGDIEGIYIEYLGIDGFPLTLDMNKSVKARIAAVADSFNGSSGLLENKIVLAMAIRHVAESYMISKIETSNPNWLEKINGSQTSELLKKFKGKFRAGDIPKSDVDDEAIELLERVNITTPENIHINSFMYEPLVDMGIGELKDLYDKVKLKLR